MGNWRKSTYSGGNGGNCVEVADAARVVRVRDTADRSGPTLSVAPHAWQVFVSALRAS
jgi:Domain of unknown function (DUF397)